MTRSLPSYQSEGKKHNENPQRTVALHHSEELDDDLGAWSDHDLALSRLFGVVDGIERIVEDGGFDHGGDGRFSMAVCD
jgi:hypothetical protein